MTGITPIGSGSTPTNNVSGTSSPSDPPSLAPSQDTISIGVTPPPISILAFGDAVNLATAKLQEQISFDSNASIFSRIPFYEGLLQDLQSLIGYLNTLLQSGGSIYNAYNENQTNITNINQDSSLISYNTTTVPADNSAIDTMNQAIQQYNSGQITQAQYQTAVNNYNAYVTSRNSSSTVTTAASDVTNFNDATDAINTIISVFNASQPSGAITYTLQQTLPSVPSLSTLNPNATPPITTISNVSTIPSATNTITPPPPDPNNYAFSTFEPLYSQLFPVLDFGSNFLGVEYNFLLANIPSLQNLSRILPPAFTTPQKKPELGTRGTTKGQGSSLQLAVMISSQDNPLLTTILDRILFTHNMTALQKSQVNSNQYSTIAQQLGIFAGAFLTSVGTLSIGEAARLLGPQLPFINPMSSYAAVVLGVAFASELSSLIERGMVSNAVKGIISKQFPNLPANSLNELSIKLAGGLELFLLLAAVEKLAIALKTPNLLGSLLATPQFKAQGVITSLPTFAQFFAGPAAQVTKNEMQMTLMNQLGVSNKIAAAVLNAAINQTTTATTTTTDNTIAEATFTNALTQGLIAHGISQNQAAAAAQLAALMLNSNIQLSNIFNEKITANTVQGTVLANEAVANIIQQHGGAITGKQLFDAMMKELQTNNLTQAQALQISTALLATINPLATPVAPKALAAHLAALVPTLPGIPQAHAQQTEIVAQTLIALLLEQEKSVTTHLLHRIQELVNTNDKNIFDKTVQQIKRFNTPTINIMGLLTAMNNPAQLILALATNNAAQYLRGDSRSNPGGPVGEGGGGAGQQPLDIPLIQG